MPNKTPPEVAYTETRKLILLIVGKFLKKFRGDREEILAQAHYHWSKAYSSWNPDKGPFAKRVGFAVWRGLLDDWRKTQALMRKRFKVQSLPKEMTSRSSDPWWRDTLIDLPDDAVLVACAALDNPEEVSESLLSQGWSGQRITRAFREVWEGVRS